MTEHLIRARFFATLHAARIIKQKSTRRDLLKLFQYAFTVGYEKGMEVK
jgi:hypothetical protein